VIEFEPNKELAWLATESFRKSDGFDWSGTTMIVELSPKGDNTVVTFTYDGLYWRTNRTGWLRSAISASGINYTALLKVSQRALKLQNHPKRFSTASPM
jgi:hypothetical protein